MPGGALNMEIRLRRVWRRGEVREPVTRRMIRAVLTEAADTGRVPPGWEIAAVQWNHRKGSTRWRTGDIRQLEEFGGFFQGGGLDHMDLERVGQVKP